MLKRVKLNAVYNILGAILPTLAGIYAVRILLSNLGTDRMGIFTLALSIVGFAGIFDLGLGRSLTQTVACAMGQEKPLSVIAILVRRTLLIVISMGIFWGILLWFTAGWFSRDVFRLEDVLAEEAYAGIHWLAVAIPVLFLTTSLIGIFEGLQKFAVVNVVKVPLSILTFLVPAIGSFETNNVGLIIGLLVIVRVFGVIVWIWILFKLLPLFEDDVVSYCLDSRPMWRFTGWLSVSNIVGPLMAQADRFYLASIFPPAMIAYYTVPLDTLSRSTILPLAAMNAAFPALAHSGYKSTEAVEVIKGAVWYIFVFWAIPIMIISIALEWLLTVWLGSEFTIKALPIAQWLLLGVLLNGFAHIPFALFQSDRRADLTAKLHVAELPIYVMFLVTLVDVYGLIGAAFAWTARVILDTGMLFLLAHFHYAILKKQLKTAIILLSGASVVVVIINFL